MKEGSKTNLSEKNTGRGGGGVKRRRGRKRRPPICPSFLPPLQDKKNQSVDGKTRAESLRECMCVSALRAHATFTGTGAQTHTFQMTLLQGSANTHTPAHAHNAAISTGRRTHTCQDVQESLCQSARLPSSSCTPSIVQPPPPTKKRRARTPSLLSGLFI